MTPYPAYVRGVIEGVEQLADIEMIGVPFDGCGRAGHQARAAGALRDAGLRDAFDHHHVIDDDDLALPDPDPHRGASTNLINEPALLAVTGALHRKVGTVVGAGRFPFVYGGDCSMLLGVVTGLRDYVGEVGLVFIAGHQDGEATNTAIELLLGLTGRLLTGQLGERVPALRPEQLVMLGPRGTASRRPVNVGKHTDSQVWLAPLAEVADDPAGAARRAIEELSDHADRWWLHIDLDVLDPGEFPAQGPADLDDEPGGLTWDQLTDLVVSLFTGPVSCVGASLASYDPDQDPDGAGAAQIVAFVRNVLVRPTISP